MGKGSTFGGPAGAVVEDDEELDMEELQHALANPYFDLPPVVRRRVDALQNLQKQYLTLHKQYQAEVRELERKYQKMYDPVFDKRANVVSGDYEPTDAEAHVEKKEEDEGVKLREASPKDAEIKGIPQFWLGVLQSHQYVDSAIFETDEDALSYLKDIRYAELEGESEGFTLTFHFAENPYFTNTVLTKTYHMEQDELFGELQYDHASGTKIEWKTGKNLTVRQVKKKSKANKKKPARMVTVEEPADSFFSFFSPVQLPAPEDEEAELDEEDAQIMEMDFEIGCIIKDKLIPFSVLWYTGEAAEYDEDDFGDEDDEDDDEDGDEEDEDEEDDEEDEPQPKKGGKKQAGPGHSFAPPPGAKPGAPGQPQQPECKQQ